jgi:hypothetical protein
MPSGRRQLPPCDAGVPRDANAVPVAVVRRQCVSRRPATAASRDILVPTEVQRGFRLRFRAHRKATQQQSLEAAPVACHKRFAAEATSSRKPRTPSARAWLQRLLSSRSLSKICTASERFASSFCGRYWLASAAQRRTVTYASLPACLFVLRTAHLPIDTNCTEGDIQMKILVLASFSSFAASIEARSMYLC